MAASNYEKRIVVFLDILGFASIVQGTITKRGNTRRKQYDQIVDFLKLTRRISGVDEKDQVSKSKMITHFSDSIVISFRVEEKSEVFYCLMDILTLLVNAVFHGFLIRGGVSVGQLVHTETQLFGPALVTAYYLESQAAIYPRIILGKEVLDIGGSSHADHHDEDTELGYLNSVVRKDSDELYYIDYFSAAQSELDEPDYDMPRYIDALKALCTHHNAVGKPALRAKHGWLKNKINGLIRDLKKTYASAKPADPGLKSYYSACDLL